MEHSHLRLLISFANNRRRRPVHSTLVMWLNTLVPTALGNGGDRWHNFYINVTLPDGTKSTLGPFTSDAPGSQYTIYTPSEVGNYTFVFYFLGQTLTNGTYVPDTNGVPYVGDWFEPSVSNVVTLPVTSTPLASWVEAPLPTSYWTLPINSANRGWSVLASNWLKGGWLSGFSNVGSWQTEGTAPTSAHILWQKP